MAPSLELNNVILIYKTKSNIMNFSNLKKYGLGLGVIASAIFMLSACNNSDQSGKNSTTSDTTAADTSHVAATPKKTGRASAKMMADEKADKMTKDKDGIYSRTEVLPVFPGGQDALQSYITDHLQYPDDALSSNVEGTVHIQFAVDEQGNISNAKAIGNKLGYGLEEEAVKVVSGMGKWTPGMIKGKKVKAWYTLPVTYSLEG
jgi:periplasmic protein TonB